MTSRHSRIPYDELDKEASVLRQGLLPNNKGTCQVTIDKLMHQLKLRDEYIDDAEQKVKDLSDLTGNLTLQRDERRMQMRRVAHALELSLSANQELLKDFR